MDAARRDALLRLTLTPGLGPRLTRRCLDAAGSPEAAVEMTATRLAGIEGIGPRSAESIRRAMDELVSTGGLDRERQLIEQHGVSLVDWDDPAYPRLLSHIQDPPPLLYVRGRLEPGDAVSIAIVGSRRCTHYGREQADRFAGLCCRAGLTVVSGGAYGIDAAVHRAALRCGGRTIAVIGSGLANPYPADHRDLFDQIASADDEGKPRGAVISELPMATPPMRENFPSRNRIISGLSLGVLVIEAADRSGALITARLAAEDHGREVMAVPGRVDSATSAGCHRAIREGWAKLVTNLDDVLDALGEAGQMLKAGKSVGERVAEPQPSLFEQNLSDSQRRIVEVLDQPRSLDELVDVTGLAVPVVQADLTMLQIRGLVASGGASGGGGGGYVRKR
jgi:DNA processing protein